MLDSILTRVKSALTTAREHFLRGFKFVTDNPDSDEAFIVYGLIAVLFIVIIAKIL